jgi:hypothetical protein
MRDMSNHNVEINRRESLIEGDNMPADFWNYPINPITGWTPVKNHQGISEGIAVAKGIIIASGTSYKQFKLNQ